MKIISYCLVVFFLFVISSPAFAQDLYEQSMSKGTASFEKKDYADAEASFRAALKESPDDYKATLYLGLVLSRDGSKEGESLLKKALRIDPQDPVVNLNLGIYYYNKSVYPEARDYFETTIELAPDTEYSAQAKQYMTKMKKGRQKPWSLTAALGMQYDSNVILGPDNMPLPEGISGKSDWLGLLYMKGQYDFIKSGGFKGSANYSLYQSLHARLSDFNITQQVAGLDAEYAVSPSVTLKGSYAFEYDLVGGNAYDYMNTLTPAVVFNYARGLSTTLSYRYSIFHFSNSDLFRDNSDRTGFNHRVGITERIPLADFLDVSVGYAFDKDNTREDFWAYRGNKGFVDLAFKIRRGLSADIYGELYKRDYEGISPTSSTRRNDNVHTYSVTLVQRLSDTFSLVLGEAYVRNQSNINVFDYKRAITSAFITARF
jgi:tetratricopeptide (TPR) repeat protein